MKDKSKLVAIILVILTITVLIITYITNNQEQDKKNNDIFIVSDYSNFYTVNSCLYRAITYISSNDVDSLILLLNEEYKEKNNVTKENVLDLFFEIAPNSTFISEKMYYESLTNDLTKYYVKGYVEENKIYDDESLTRKEQESIYFIVYLDSSDNVFSIEPYDGEIFKVGD